MKAFSKINALLAGLCALLLLNADATAQASRSNRERRTRSQQNASATDAQTAPGQGFDAFRLVRTRNIFDPDRRPMVQPSSNPQPRPQPPPPTRSDYVALTGTMVTEEKALAFFTGSRSEYSKVLPAADSIAGAKILKITPTGIEVERDGKKTAVAVGQTVPLDDSAPAPAPAAVPENAAAASATSSSTETPSAPGTAPADAADVLKRMMERRQQELK